MTESRGIDSHLSTIILTGNHNSPHIPSSVLIWFEGLDNDEREEVLKGLVRTCDLSVLSTVHELLEILLQRDFISKLPEELALRILSYLDSNELCAVERTCKTWRVFVQTHSTWLWQLMCRRRGWDPKYHAFRPSPDEHPDKAFYSYKYMVEENWAKGRYIKRTFTGHTKAVFYVQMEDTVLFSGSFDHTIKIWDVNTGECTRTLNGHIGGIGCLRYNKGLLVSGSSDTTLRVWNVASGKCEMVLQGHEAEVAGLYHDGHTLMSTSLDHTLRVWDLRTGQCIRVLTGHSDYVLSVQFDPENIVTASFDRTVRVWDRKTGMVLMVLVGHTMGVRCVRFDRQQIVSGSEDTTVRIWDRQSGVCTAVLRGHENEVWGVQMLHTGYGNNSWLRRIVSGGRDGIRVWEAPNFQCHVIIRSWGPRPGTICIDLDPCTIVSSSFDNTISLYSFDVAQRDEQSTRSLQAIENIFS